MPINLENLKKSIDKMATVIDVEEDVLFLGDEERETLNKTAENYKALSNIIEQNMEKLRGDLASIADEAIKEQIEKVIYEFPRNPAFKRIVKKIESGDRISVDETKKFMGEMKDAKDVLENLETEVDISFDDLVNQFADSITKLSATEGEQTEHIQSLISTMGSQSELISQNILNLESEDLDEEQLAAMEKQNEELSKINSLMKRMEVLAETGVAEEGDSQQELKNILSELKDTTFETKLYTSMRGVDGAIRSLSVDQERLNETIDDLNETNKSVLAGTGEKIGAAAKSLKGAVLGGLFESLGLGGLDRAVGISETIGNIGLGDIADLRMATGGLGRGRKRGGRGATTKGRRRGRRGRRGGLLGLAGLVGGGGLALSGILGGDEEDSIESALEMDDLADVADVSKKGRGAKRATKATKATTKGATKGVSGVGKLAKFAKAGKVGGLGALKGIARGARFLGPLGAVVTAGMTAYDIYSGVKRTNEIFELGEKEATLGQKTAAGLGSAISGLTFGLVGEKTAAKGVHKIGSFISEHAERMGPLGAAFAAVKGVENVGELFGLKKGEKATAGQNVSAGLGGAISAMTFGAIDTKSAAKSIQSFGELFTGKEEETILLPQRVPGAATGVVKQQPKSIADAQSAISKQEMQQREVARSAARGPAPSQITQTQTRDVYVDKRSQIDDLGLLMLNTDFFG